MGSLGRGGFFIVEGSFLGGRGSGGWITSDVSPGGTYTTAGSDASPVPASISTGSILADYGVGGMIYSDAGSGEIGSVSAFGSRLGLLSGSGSVVSTIFGSLSSSGRGGTVVDSGRGDVVGSGSSSGSCDLGVG